jgi:hypothetical protein
MVEYSWETLRELRQGHERPEVRVLADAIVSASQRSREPLSFDKYDPLGRQFTDFKVLSRFIDLRYDEWSSFFNVKRGLIGLMGISLHHFTGTESNWKLPNGEAVNFAAFIQSKVVIDGCNVVLVIMDETNPALPQMLRMEEPGEPDDGVIDTVRAEVVRSSKRWQRHIANVAEHCANTGGSGTLRLVKVRHGMIYHRLSITDHGAIVTPYFFHIGTNSGGPGLVVGASTAWYAALRRDFEYLVERNGIPSAQATSASVA